jgi:hypothetical protein
VEKLTETDIEISDQVATVVGTASRSIVTAPLRPSTDKPNKANATQPKGFPQP